MPLPKIATPTYELELPSTEQTVRYRPFLVKEEKLLVLALETEDTKQITNAIKSVLKSCVLTKGVKVETLPTFDIEYLFLNIRGKSVGEELEVKVICPDDEKTEVPITIDLDEVKVQKSEGHDKQLKLDDKLMGAFIRGKSALPDAETFTLMKNGTIDTLKLIIGYSTINTNRVTIPVKTQKMNDFEMVSFNAKHFKSVLSANKECKEALLQVSAEGLAKISFAHDNFEVTYYLVAVNN